MAKPTTQETYSESDLAPIKELVNLANKQSFWESRFNDVINLTFDGTRYITGTAGLWDAGTHGDTDGNDLKGQSDKVDGDFEKILRFNKSAVNNDERLAEVLVDKLYNSRLNRTCSLCWWN